MKRTPFYRRPGKVGKFSGLRERVIWMILEAAKEVISRTKGGAA